RSPSRRRYSPDLKMRLEAQPATRSRCSEAMPSNIGASRTSSSTLCILLLPDVAGADGGGLLRDVDRDPAPGDAAAAADAARSAQLVDRARELVGHPLPVATLVRAADAAAVDVGVLEREAGLPLAHPGGFLAGEVCHILDAAAEAGRADQRAVTAREAAV